jgi:hypothetical protein
MKMVTHGFEIREIPSSGKQRGRWIHVAKALRANPKQAVFVPFNGAIPQNLRCTGYVALRKIVKEKVRSHTEADGVLFWLEQK